MRGLSKLLRVHRLVGSTDFKERRTRSRLPSISVVDQKFASGLPFPITPKVITVHSLPLLKRMSSVPDSTMQLQESARIPDGKMLKWWKAKCGCRDVISMYSSARAYQEAKTLQIASVARFLDTICNNALGESHSSKSVRSHDSFCTWKKDDAIQNNAFRRGDCSEKISIDELWSGDKKGSWCLRSRYRSQMTVSYMR